ncbi:MAG: hypothetical protein AVDCRST_MAG50-324 [uncultured Acidimicrobiales bacterium]|uniref:Glycosyltransferase RgtA/B/C/D-like domain-containing protein n=1 Tax=uncultured Acidimicrobiales bacterium TaxID=310071 RepID=A0A6J4H996_9ACTN|nr:MAG: hypothetical protein AVDCRST_MAG50-324 [uncultured Acidimicrobiales bacterium]
MTAAPTATEATRPDFASQLHPVGPTAHRGEIPRWVVVSLGLVVIAGTFLRFFARSPLWLDETLSVNIATVPLGELRGALERDGAPPLYYLILHGWTKVFGTGDTAVRSLSGVFSAATLPLFWFAGRRVGGRSGAIAALTLGATSPYAIRFGVETRMYSLVALLVFAAWLLLANLLERPRAHWFAGVAIVSGLLVLTHYWSFYLLAATVVMLGYRWRRGRGTEPRHALIAIGAIATGGILFVPWLRTFLYQTANTGTPWGAPATPIDVVITTVLDFGGGRGPLGRILSICLASLILLGIFGRALDARRIELDLRTRPESRHELIVAGATLMLAVLAGYVSGSAFASRYASVVFPFAILIAAIGTKAIADRRIAGTLLVVCALCGLGASASDAVKPRTQAQQVANAIAAAGGQPGDVVVYCPDQVAPDVNRVLPDGYREMTFPDKADPRFVNWVGYAARMKAVDPEQFAGEILELAPDATIWHVWTSGYRTLGKRCERINDALAAARPAAKTLLDASPRIFEKHNLTRHPVS